MQSASESFLARHVPFLFQRRDVIGSSFRTPITEALAYFAVGWRRFTSLAPILKEIQHLPLRRCQLCRHTIHMYSILNRRKMQYDFCTRSLFCLHRGVLGSYAEWAFRRIRNDKRPLWIANRFILLP